MPDIIKIDLPPETKELIERVKEFPDRALYAIARGMNRGTELMLGKITMQRFTGKGPFPVSQHRLGVRTNRLRSSLRRTAAAIDGTRVVAAIGSNVQYFGPHEFGFSGSVKVKSHQRRSPLGDRFQLGEQSISRKAARKAGLVDRGKRKKDKVQQVSSRIAMVKAHTRKVDVPKRAPLATGIEENGAMLILEISVELRRVWEGTES